MAASAQQVEDRVDKGTQDRPSRPSVIAPPQASGIANGDEACACRTPAVGAGAHLVREWNGRTYRLEVLADGCHMDGRTHCSLSAVARRITGTAWSEPRFFGLADRKGNS